MSKAIGIDDLEKVIVETLEAYEKVTLQKMEKAVVNATKEGVKKLKATSPKLTGKYAAHWSYKKNQNGRGKGRYGRTGTTIYVKPPEYRKSHLLENGHAKRGGGRVAPKEHIKPVEEEIIETLEKKLGEEL